MLTARDVVTFWLDEVSPQQRFTVDPALDQTIRDRFGAAWESAAEGGLGVWLTDAEGALGYVILVDQFSRNMFRDDPRAFSTDPSARAATAMAVNKGWDREVRADGRAFFYMPLMHSEDLADQDRCIELVAERLPEDPGTLLHARCHREIIRSFGRFPFRNAALGRESSPEERAFLDEGGYGALVRRFQDSES